MRHISTPLTSALRLDLIFGEHQYPHYRTEQSSAPCQESNNLPM
jgi:hypothetical protein